MSSRKNSKKAIKPNKEEENRKNQETEQAAPGGAWDTGKGPLYKEDEKILLKIEEHPFKRKPAAAAVSLIFITGVSIMSWYVLKYPLTPIFIFLFFIVSNTSFFLPSRYTFTEEKFVVDRIIYQKSYPWSRFRGYASDRNGVYISPSSDPSRFDRFRGVFLVMTEENRKRLMPILEEVINGSPVHD